MGEIAGIHFLPWLRIQREEEDDLTSAQYDRWGPGAVREKKKKKKGRGALLGCAGRCCLARVRRKEMGLAQEGGRGWLGWAFSYFF